MRVVADYTEGLWAERPDGREATRSFLVLDLEGVSSQMLRDAVNAPGVPDRGDAHPDDSSIVCWQKTGSPVNDQTALVRCEYAIPTWRNSPETVSQQITIDASVIEQKSWFDIFGTRLSATFTGPVVITQYPSATLAQNAVTITVSKLETTSESDLMRRAINFVEHVNNATWFGWPAKTWKVDDIQVRPSPLNGYREVETVLTYRSDTWRFLATYIEQGRLPPSATEGNGFEYYDVRELANFSTLPITVPTP